MAARQMAVLIVSLAGCATAVDDTAGQPRSDSSGTDSSKSEDGAIDDTRTPTPDTSRDPDTRTDPDTFDPDTGDPDTGDPDTGAEDTSPVDTGVGAGCKYCTGACPPLVESFCYTSCSLSLKKCKMDLAGTCTCY